ncbi:hypothetical protein FOCC_FOCC004360, partial [Frankliniella occidentalis]
MEPQRLDHQLRVAARRSDGDHGQGGHDDQRAAHPEGTALGLRPVQVQPVQRAAPDRQRARAQRRAPRRHAARRPGQAPDVAPRAAAVRRAGRASLARSLLIVRASVRAPARTPSWSPGPRCGPRRPGIGLAPLRLPRR